MKYLILLLCTGSVVAAEPAKPALPTMHTAREIEGWTVHVDQRLLDKDHAALGAQALKLLESRLRDIVLIVPADKVKELRKVPIWLDLTCGTLKPMQYHPSKDWLAKNGYDRTMEKAVHIPDAAYFAAPRLQRHQPWAMLHEMAHAYHDRVLGFNHAEIKQAYDAFRKQERYLKTLHVDGREGKHYALTNEKEFFAEMSEAYFGANDFFPFNSGELKKEEPTIFALLEKIWGKLP